MGQHCLDRSSRSRFLFHCDRKFLAFMGEVGDAKWWLFAGLVVGESSLNDSSAVGGSSLVISPSLSKPDSAEWEDSSVSSSTKDGSGGIAESILTSGIPAPPSSWSLKEGGGGRSMGTGILHTTFEHACVLQRGRGRLLGPSAMSYFLCSNHGRIRILIWNLATGPGRPHQLRMC